MSRNTLNALLGSGVAGLILAPTLVSCGPSSGPDAQRSGRRELALPAALKQLDQLSAPPAADAQVFAQLKASFRQMLERSGKLRFTSAAPSAAGGTVEDLLLTDGGSEVALGWAYTNRGDYDQNSEVNIADISPLGAHFGKGSSAPDWFSKARAADGDRNGLNTISDLTPIGAAFMASVDGYRVQASPTPAQESSWADVTTVTFEQSTLEGGSPFRRFSHSLELAVVNSYYRVLPYSGAQLGPPSNYVQYSLAPPAVTSVSPVSGDTGTPLQFSALLSGGTPQSYAWDFGGGADPDTSTVAQPTVTLGAIAVYDASLTVTNAAGSDTFDFSLDVTQVDPPLIDNVQPQTGIAGTAVGFSAALSGGAPATYAWDFGGGATPDTDSAPAPSVMLTTSGSYNASLTVTNGGGSATFPFTLVVYQPPSASFTATPQNGEPGEQVELDASASSDDGSIVKYEWDLDGDGSFELNNGIATTQAAALRSPAGSVNVSLRVTDDGGWTDTDTKTLSSLPGVWQIASPNPDSEGDVGISASMAMVNGRPAISYGYRDNNIYDLRYVHATDADGSSWGVPLTLDSAGDVGRYPSLAVVNGNPAIAYYDNTSADLRFIRATDADGNAWGAPTVADGVGIVGPEASLVVVNGRPAMTYRDSLNLDLKYVRATNPDGSAWGAPLTLDSGGDVGTANSLKVISGNPAVSYHDATNLDLKYLRALNPDGSAWGAPQIVDSAGRVGESSSMEQVNGLPAISYYDYDNAALKYVRASLADGSAWGAPQELDSAAGDGVGANSSMAVVGGRAAICYYDYLNRSLKYIRATDPNGSSWGAPLTLDSNETVGLYSSLAEVNGRPAIGYWDSSNYDLKYIRLY